MNLYAMTLTSGIYVLFGVDFPAMTPLKNTTITLNVRANET